MLRVRRNDAGVGAVAWLVIVALVVVVVVGAVYYVRRPVAQAPQQLDGTVAVLGVWGGGELDSFLAMVKPFEDATGVKVAFEGTRDLNAVLTTRVQGGNPPDVAMLPGPGQVAEFAQQGRIQPLDGALDLSAMQEQYAQSWIDLATVDGKVYGVFIKAALKGLIWYNPKAFAAAGYQVPETWDALLQLTERIAAEGKTPWCIGLESGAASGWPATDWIEDIMLRTAGAQTYDQWYRHEIAWNDPAVKRAWELFGSVAADSKFVRGGVQGVLATNFGDSPSPMFTDPPGCYLHHQATFIQDFIQKAYPNLRPVEDFNFFAFPPIDPNVPKAVEVGGDIAVMFKDTPQSRALMKHLTTPEAQAIWVKRGGALSPNRKVSLDDYPDPLSRRAAEILTSADIARFDASDLMPEAVNNTFWKGTLDYVQNPARLDAILANLEQVAQEAYKK
ncbi:MAG: carbohydrate ABC transporter substrate-binding protein [Armatimonadetes bacterium]|nr:carbohydrate ABC transporter substrate-binding protein [Armatimonadota bacterium]MBI2973777.1 carbohydrate ABC transporter substrate-binding protein [Armatimonadota bacterium]